MVNPSERFAEVLEACIRTGAEYAAATLPQWGKSCTAPTVKIDLQAAVLENVLPSIYQEYGYPAALWCAFYSVRMTGAEYDPNDDQPNNPNYPNWYSTLLCPWDLSPAPVGCGDEALGLHGNEWEGVPVQWASPERQNPQYLTDPPDIYVTGEPDRRTMSCGLCSHLRTRLGSPPYTLDPGPIDDPGDEWLYTSNWDFHPFGAWLANDAARRGVSVEQVVQNIHQFKASNGEEMHGYLWQSLRLLAYDTGTLEGQRKDWVDDNTGQEHAMRVCSAAWYQSPQTRDDCAHAAGHGFFYYYLDVGRAVSACWTDRIVAHTPGIEFDLDGDTRLAGLNAADLLKWRWLCSTGVYHAAGNTLSVEILRDISNIGSSVEEYLCKRSALWGDDARYFDRCAAGLGMRDAEGRLDLVRKRRCKPRLNGARQPVAPAAWETLQFNQFGQPLQLSCNPALYFPLANTKCPMAYKAHFPCVQGTLDYDFCTGARGGMEVTAFDVTRQRRITSFVSHTSQCAKSSSALRAATHLGPNAATSAGLQIQCVMPHR